jgi:purine-binding chemotaxis protein CheW
MDQPEFSTMTISSTQNESSKTMSAGKYLTFKLGPEAFGIGILKVQEIIGMLAVTRMPRTPTYVRGVVNLRGKVIPVLDLRLKFGMDTRQDTERTCIIVVQLLSGEAKVTMGLIVDEVSEVLDVTAAQIEPPPNFGSTLDVSFIMGMGKVGQKVVQLLDADRILMHQEFEAIGTADPTGVHAGIHV